MDDTNYYRALRGAVFGLAIAIPLYAITWLLLSSIPANQIDLDFRVNLLTELIGMGVTVFLLTVLVGHLGDYFKWKIVEKEAKKDLKGLLDRLLIDLSNLIKKPSLSANFGAPDLQTFRAVDISVLMAIHDCKSVYFRDNEPETSMRSADYCKIFLDSREQLNSIESKYLRFWPTDLIKELMIIQRNLFTLSWVFKTIEHSPVGTSPLDIIGRGDKRFAEYRIKDIMDSLYRIYQRHKLDFPDAAIYADSDKFDQTEISLFTKV